jgi:hypothetical protein
VRPARFAEPADQHIIPGFQVEHEKLKCRLAEFADQTIQSLKPFARTDIDNQGGMFDLATGYVDPFNQFRDKGYGEIVDTEKTEIFEGL